MSLSTFAAKIAVPLAVLGIAVALPMTASATPAVDNVESTAPASATDCFPGDGHPWHG